MDIVLYTKPEILAHKQGGDGFEEYYWYLSRPPKNFEEGDKVYFATKGFIRGYFVCNDFNPDERNNPEYDETICWNKNSWKEEKVTVPASPFRSFRYKWW